MSAGAPPPLAAVSATPPSAARSWFPRVLALGILAPAFAGNLALTRDLTWPGINIQYREMATAQTSLDEGAGRDPAYRGESLWYNPLSGWVVAFTSSVTGRPLRVLVPRIGPYVNLLAPLGFFVLVGVLAGEWTALAATSAFLFLTGNSFPFWLAASYSPWFAPENYGQGLLYLALVLAVMAERKGWSIGGHVGLGLALGAIFLAHTAPAVIFGVVLVLLAALRAGRGARPTTAAGGLAVSLVTALLASSALVWPIAGRYHLSIVNPYPAESPTDLRVTAMLTTLSMHTPFLLAAIAMPVFAWRRRRSAEGQVLLCWIVAVVSILAYGDLRYVLHKFSVALPTPVPTYHFLFHGLALVSVGFGIATAGLARRVASWLPGQDPTPRQEWLMAIVAVGVVMLGWSSHSRRPDATEVREAALSFGRAMPAGAFEWIRASTRSDDVFLSSDDVSLFLVSPAGRKVVCTNVYFSNPFVDWTARQRDRDRLLQLARDGDLEAFDRLAALWGVRYVVASDGLSRFLSEQAGVDRSEHPPLARKDIEGRPGFDAVFVGEGLAIYRRSPAGSPPSLPSTR